MTHEEFYSIYGDSYVWSIIEGGTFIGVVTMKTRSKSDKLEVQAKLDASFSGVQVKGSGAYNIDELEAMASTEIHVYYSGGKGVNPGK